MRRLAPQNVSIDNIVRLGHGAVLRHLQRAQHRATDAARLPPPTAVGAASDPAYP